MEPAEMLGTASQIAITMAGFAGVVVVFGRNTVHEWSAIDKFRLRLLLGTSTSALALCLIGLALLSAQLDPRAVWQWCSCVVIAAFAYSTASSLRTYLRFRAEDLKASGARPWIFYATSSAGIAATALQVYNILVPQGFWPFFVAIVLALLVSTLQFTRMILAPHDTP